MLKPDNKVAVHRLLGISGVAVVSVELRPYLGWRAALVASLFGVLWYAAVNLWWKRKRRDHVDG
jgi:hypothetical protein